MASEKDAETVEHSGRAGKQKASARNSLENIAEKALDGSSATIRNDAEKDGSGKDDVVEERDNESREDDDDDVDIEAQQDAIARVETSATRSSARSSRISRLASRFSKKKEHLAPVTLPLSDLDNGVVGWDSQDDPEMPLNFTQRRKWLIVGFLSMITFMTPFASSVLAPGIENLAEEFHSGLVLASMPVSIFLLGYAVGPLFLAPLSEIYGRNIVLGISNYFFCLWQIGCALAPSLNSLIVFRFFSGVGGSACLTLGGAVIGDMFPVDQRGSALAMWTIGPLIGPTIGPLVGAFVAQTIGWRWDFWIVLIAGAAVTTVLVVFNRETNHRVLVQRKVARLRKELARPDLRSVYDETGAAAKSRAQILANGLLRPLKLLFLSPLVFGLSLYVAFAYGCLYLLFNSIPPTFEGQYGWSTGVTGLTYLSIGLGYAVGLAVFSVLSDSTVVRMTKANNGVYEPEMRLPFCVFFGLLLPVTFFWYGWSAEAKVHWIVPIIGLFPFGFGIIGIWQPIQAYLIDAYLPFAASALAAFTVLRSIIAAFLPLAGPSLFAHLGLGWGNSLLGFICAGLIPVPMLIYKFGGQLRKSQKLKL